MNDIKIKDVMDKVWERVTVRVMTEYSLANLSQILSIHWNDKKRYRGAIWMIPDDELQSWVWDKEKAIDRLSEAFIDQLFIQQPETRVGKWLNKILVKFL